MRYSDNRFLNKDVYEKTFRLIIESFGSSLEGTRKRDASENPQGSFWELSGPGPYPSMFDLGGNSIFSKEIRKGQEEEGVESSSSFGDRLNSSKDKKQESPKKEEYINKFDYPDRYIK